MKKILTAVTLMLVGFATAGGVHVKDARSTDLTQKLVASIERFGSTCDSVRSLKFTDYNEAVDSMTRLGSSRDSIPGIPVSKSADNKSLIGFTGAFYLENQPMVYSGVIEKTKVNGGYYAAMCMSKLHNY